MNVEDNSLKHFNNLKKYEDHVSNKSISSNTKSGKISKKKKAKKNKNNDNVDEENDSNESFNDKSNLSNNSSESFLSISDDTSSYASSFYRTESKHDRTYKTPKKYSKKLRNNSLDINSGESDKDMSSDFKSSNKECKQKYLNNILNLNNCNCSNIHTPFENHFENSKNEKIKYNILHECNKNGDVYNSHIDNVNNLSEHSSNKLNYDYNKNSSKNNDKNSSYEKDGAKKLWHEP